jgi:transcriptional regulator with XRE-family HTH domain
MSINQMPEQQSSNNQINLHTGNFLRLLRLSRNISIENLAGSCGFNYRTLQKIEKGETKQPNREILLALLRELNKIKKLDATERNKVLEPFGYRDQAPLPEKTEITYVTQQWEKSVFELPHPACLVDFAHRVHSWNRYAPRLVGLTYGHPGMENIRGKTLFDLLFNKNFSDAFGLQNKEDFLVDMLEVMRSEFEAFKEEDWCKECIQATSEAYPEFSRLWEEIQSKPVRQLSLRMIGPFLLEPKDSAPLSFYMLGTDFMSDSRFRVIQYLPANIVTMRQCLEWVEAESEN